MPQSQTNETTTETTPRTVEFDLSNMKPWREYAVILFNDDEHSFPEVEEQLIRALRCHPARAQELAYLVDQAGRATVAIAPRERAFHIVAILRQINLRVGLRQIN